MVFGKHLALFPPRAATRIKKTVAVNGTDLNLLRDKALRGP